MPKKYIDRLNLSINGSKDLCFFTQNGLRIAKGYEKIVFKRNVPHIEFSEFMLDEKNIYIPENQKWRIISSACNHIEYRSRDYCNIKIIQWKKNKDVFKMNMFYISPFQLRSNEIPVLIDPLYRKQTLQNI